MTASCVQEMSGVVGVVPTVLNGDFCVLLFFMMLAHRLPYCGAERCLFTLERCQISRSVITS